MTSPLRAMDPNAVAQDLEADLGITLPPLVRMSKSQMLALANASLVADGKTPLTPLQRMGEFGAVANAVQELFTGEAATPTVQPIEQVGSAFDFPILSSSATGSKPITVPAGTDFVTVGVSMFIGTAHSMSDGAITMTKGGVDSPMTSAGGEGDASTGVWQCALWHMAAPDVGSSTLKWTFTHAPDNMAECWSVTFWKNVDSVRDTNGAQSGSFPIATPTLTVQDDDDLILAFAGGYSGSQDGTFSTWTNLTELHEATRHDYSCGAWATGASSSNVSVAAATAANISQGGIMAIVLKPVIE